MLGLGALDTVQVALDQARVAVADWHIERGLPVVTDGTGQFVEHVTEDHPLGDCATMGNREGGATAGPGPSPRSTPPPLAGDASPPPPPPPRRHTSRRTPRPAGPRPARRAGTGPGP